MSRKLSDDPFRALDDRDGEIIDEVWEAYAMIGRKYDMTPEQVEDIVLDCYEAVDEEMVN